MASTRMIELRNSGETIERRKALQGLAGSLAGVAAFSAMGASAKKKKKKKGSAGTLVRIQPAQQTDSIPGLSTQTVTVTCPAAGNKEEVFAVSGGFDVSTSPNVGDFVIRASQFSNSLKGWAVTFANTNAGPQNATATVLCAYFKTR